MTSRYLILTCMLFIVHQTMAAPTPFNSNDRHFPSFTSNTADRFYPSHVMDRLIQIKYQTELMLMTATPTQKDSALVVYNTIRWHLDGLVYAVATDMIAKNNTKAYRILQDLSLYDITLKEKHPYQWLEKQWQVLNTVFDEKVLQVSNQKNINLTTNVFYIIKDSWSFLEGIQKIKSDRIKTIMDLLDQTRLSPPLLILKK